MFTCAYCGTQFMEHKPNCSNCGAAIKIESAPAKRNIAPGPVYDVIYKICDQYQGVSSFYFDDTINAARMKNVITNFNIPQSEKVIMVYDDTILNLNNKVGFAICTQGLYWKNDWSVDTKRNYLSWEEFVKREIKRDDLHVDLGKGDRIGMAGSGSNEIRDRAVKMLNEIKNTIQAK